MVVFSSQATVVLTRNNALKKRLYSFVARRGQRELQAGVIATSLFAATGPQRSITSSSPQLEYDKYLSRRSSLRRPSAIRKLQPLVSLPSMISLGGGLPNPSLFPITDLSFTLQYPSGNIDDEQKEVKINLSSKEVATALQYSNTSGLPILRDQLLDIQRREHATLSTDANNYEMDLAITVGSQDGFCKAIEMLIDVDKKGDDKKDKDDFIFLESPTYSGALAFLQPLEANLVPVPIDQYGLIPGELEKALKAKQKETNNSVGKRVLYTIPTAQNPSGATLSTERRHEIYQLAVEYDMIILEDDPYYFLHPSREALPSFLSIDIQQMNDNSSRHGRVLRFDSVSKLISSGLRIGFVTGPAPFIEKLNFHIQATNLHNCGLSQMMLQKTLEAWEENYNGDGFDNHCRQVAHFYNQRRDVLINACEKYLGPLREDGLQWFKPEAGMFLWIKLPNYITDSKVLIEQKAAKANVLLIPGQAFDPLDQSSQYVRASYSTASDENMDIAMKRLADLIKEEKKIQQQEGELNINWSKKEETMKQGE